MDPEQEAIRSAGSDGAELDIPALYNQHRDVMYRIARSMLREDGLQRADDVVQEVMISVLSKPPRDVRNWEAFFVRAVQNKIYDLWKSAGHRRESLVLDDAVRFEHELGPDDMGSDPAVVVEEALEREEIVTRVRGALAELARTDPEGAYVYRQIKAFERTSSDLAAEMNISDSRVRQHVMRARKRLMEILEASGGAQ